MQHELLDAFETESGDIKFSFYREANSEKVFVWLSVGQAGVKIPSTLVGDFLEVADAIRIYLEWRNPEDV